MTPTDFVSRVRAADPRLDAVVDGHLAEHDELLLHLLVADLRRCAEAAQDSRDFALRDSVLSLMDSALADGDEALDNAVAVSFVEDSAWWEPGKEEYLASWPSTLTDEVNRQRSITRMTTGVQNRWPRPTWLRGLAALCMLGIGYFVGIAITGVLIFFLDVPLAESLAKWLSAVLGVVLAISFVVWRRPTWLVEDAGDR